MKVHYHLITTEYRGVFCGELIEERDNGRTVVLKDARCAINWETSKGFLELADSGPNEKSLIGAPAIELTVYGVTSKAKCTERATLLWRSAR